MEKVEPPVKRWQVVRGWVIGQIESGAWTTAAKLPSIRALARMFDISITTVQRALSDLQANAYILGEPRVGYRVAAAVQARPAKGFDLSGVTVNVNHAVVSMLAQAASRDRPSLSSAVLQADLAPDVLLNKCLVAVASKAGTALSGLVAPPGLAALRRQIAGLMLARGVVCSPDDVLVTSGDTTALELALEAVAPKGATIAIETPTYYGILQTIERLGMRALPIRTDAQQGMDLEHLEQVLKPGKVAAIFLNPTLQNPRGFIMSNAARARLAQLAADADVPIIEDDIFFDLVPEQARPRAIKSYAPTDNTLYCSSFSKTVAPGYRVGWCVPGKYRQAILAQMFSRNLAVSSIAQHVLSAFIGRGYMEEHCVRLRARLAQVTEAVQSLVHSDFPPGTQYLPPSGGFIHWLEFAAHIDMAALERLACERGCHVTGSGIFFAQGRPAQGLRICLGTSLSADVVHSLKTLGACAHEASAQA